jgi:three-Cys-motif partner protein
MPSLDDYVDREPAYVKHVFLERYLEVLFHKTGHTYNQVVYVDGFAGPWQSTDEAFGDTSFGIALSALRKAKASLKQQRGRNVKMTALLVEKDKDAYARLETVRARFPDIIVKTYPGDFLAAVPSIMVDIPRDAFSFCLIDPKGWAIPLEKLRPLLKRQKSEVLFNFMFDFINRAAGMSRPITVEGLNELMPDSNWQQRLRDVQALFPGHDVPLDLRKEILVGAFGDSLKQIGGYHYVAETTVLRPLKERPLYCLVYATDHETGIEVFRDCQMAAMKAQSEVRGAGKIRNKAERSGQGEMFDSVYEMTPDDMLRKLAEEKKHAAGLIIQLVPKAPDSIEYRKLWASVLARYAVRKPDVNKMCGAMRKSGELLFPDWEPRKQVPDDHYRVQRP